MFGFGSSSGASSAPSYSTLGDGTPRYFLGSTEVRRAAAVDSVNNRENGIDPGFNLSLWGGPPQGATAAPVATPAAAPAASPAAGGVAGLGTPGQAATSGMDYTRLMSVAPGEKSIGNAIGRGIMAGARNDVIAQLPEGYTPVLATFQMGSGIKSKPSTA